MTLLKLFLRSTHVTGDSLSLWLHLSSTPAGEDLLAPQAQQSPLEVPSTLLTSSPFDVQKTLLSETVVPGNLVPEISLHLNPTHFSGICH